VKGNYYVNLMMMMIMMMTHPQKSLRVCEMQAYTYLPATRLKKKNLPNLSAT